MSTTLKRLYVRQDPETLGVTGRGYSTLENDGEVRVVPEPEANLVSSLCEDLTHHMPVLDIDRIPCRLVESSTPGNYHLYIDKPMTWSAYLGLLTALNRVGIIEDGYLASSKARGWSALRHNCKKPLKEEA